MLARQVLVRQGAPFSSNWRRILQDKFLPLGTAHTATQSNWGVGRVLLIDKSQFRASPWGRCGSSRGDTVPYKRSVR